jgi:hypothetical protein
MRTSDGLISRVPAILAIQAFRTFAPIRIDYADLAIGTAKND